MDINICQCVVRNGSRIGWLTVYITCGSDRDSDITLEIFPKLHSDALFLITQSSSFYRVCRRPPTDRLYGNVTNVGACTTTINHAFSVQSSDLASVDDPLTFTHSLTHSSKTGRGYTHIHT